MTDRSHMTIERLREVLDAYGANPDRWPREERAAAQALLAESAEARRSRDASLQLDAILDLAPANESSPALLERIAAAAFQGAATETPVPSRFSRPSLRVLPARARENVPWHRPAWRYVGAALPLAAAAGLVLWLLYRPAPIAPTASLAVAEIGVYDAPTDALLTAPGVNDLDTVPSFGCTDSGLGCLDPLPANRQSALHWETYV